MPVEQAFAVFTDGMASWWPPDHHLLEGELAEMVVEGRVGGRIYDRGVDGSELTWAHVLAFEPPRRVAFSWDITPQWKVEDDPARRSEVDVTFEPVEAGTLVRLCHRHWSATATAGRGCATPSRHRAAGAGGSRRTPGRQQASSRVSLREPPLAERDGERDFLRSGSLAGLAGGLKDARQALERRRREEGGAALQAELAIAEVRVAVALRAERVLGVVEVQRAEPLEPELGLHLRHHGVDAGRGAHVVAGGQQVAGVQTQAEALVAAGGVDQLAELVDRAPERAARARRVLQMQRTARRCRRARPRSSRRRA